MGLNVFNMGFDMAVFVRHKIQKLEWGNGMQKSYNENQGQP